MVARAVTRRHSLRRPSTSRPAADTASRFALVWSPRRLRCGAAMNVVEEHDSAAAADADRDAASGDWRGGEVAHWQRRCRPSDADAAVPLIWSVSLYQVPATSAGLLPVGKSGAVRAGAIAGP